MKMKSKQLEILIRGIIKETVQVLNEAENGEWWIYPGGDAQFADGNVGDSGHEGYVIQHVSQEIYEHFCGNAPDEMGYLSEHEDELLRSLKFDERLSDEEIEEWQAGRGPTEVLERKLLEDKVYSTPEQASDAVMIAWGASSKDARDYAMKYLGWKRMTSHGGTTVFQTWNFNQNDLDDMRRGIDSAWGWEDENEDKFGFVEIEVKTNNRSFTNIPLSKFDKISIRDIIQYQRRDPWMKEQHMTTKGWINEGIFHEHKDWIIYEGDNKITTIFEDNSRLSFEVGYPPQTWNEDRDRWKHKAASKWKTIAREIYNGTGLSEAGNPIVKPWKVCYQEALNSPEMKEFKHKDAAPIFDSVNLTPR